MDSPTIIKFLGCLKAKHVQARGKWVTCSCVLAPWHHGGTDARPSFAIRVEPNKPSYFNCFVCKSGKLDDLVAELQHLKSHNIGHDLAAAWNLLALEEAQKLDLQVKDWGEYEEEQLEYPIPEWWLEAFRSAWPVPYAREYLESRSVNEEITNALDIRWDRSLFTVCFPVRNGDGELVSMRGRFITPKSGSPPYHVYPFMGQQNGQAWLGEHSVNYDAPVLMVESVFDVASVMRVYRNILSPMTVGISKARLARVSQCSEIVTMFDRGEGGDKARGLVSKYLGTAMINHVLPTHKDPGEDSEAELRERLALYLPLKS